MTRRDIATLSDVDDLPKIKTKTSRNNQISSSFQEKRHGIFTYYLLKGICPSVKLLDELGQIFTNAERLAGE